MGIPSPLWGWEALLIYTQNNTRRLRTETSPLGSPVIVRSCECFRTSRTSKLATNSFNLMNRSVGVRNTHQCLTDITEVVFTFQFGVKHHVTSSTIIC